MALKPGLPWNVIHPGLQATTILGQRTFGSGTFCPLCQECDHLASSSTLAQLQQLVIRGNSPRNMGPGFGRICSSWNDGACTYPGSCTCHHVYSNCFQPSHPAKDCWLPPRVRSGMAPVRPAASMPRSSSS